MITKPGNSSSCKEKDWKENVLATSNTVGRRVGRGGRRSLCVPLCALIHPVQTPFQHYSAIASGDWRVSLSSYELNGTSTFSNWLDEAKGMGSSSPHPPTNPDHLARWKQHPSLVHVSIRSIVTHKKENNAPSTNEHAGNTIPPF